MILISKSQQKSLVYNEAEMGFGMKANSSFTRAKFLGRRLKNQALPNLQDRASYFIYAKSGCSYKWGR